MKKNGTIIKFETELSDYNDFFLIGIHSTQDDYRLAFLLNRLLDFQLEKDIDLTFNNLSFSLFSSFDELKNTEYKLVKNKINIIKQQPYSIDLFAEEFSTETHAFPELKKVDYLLKIVYENSKKKDYYISTLNKSTFVSTAYEIEIKTIKTKELLLF